MERGIPALTGPVDLGYEVVRATWPDLTQPAGLTRRIRAAVRRSADRRTPIAGSVTASRM